MGFLEKNASLFDDPDEGVDPDTLWADYTDDITDDQEEDNKAPVTVNAEPVNAELVNPVDPPKVEDDKPVEDQQTEDSSNTGEEKKTRSSPKGEIKIVGYITHFRKCGDVDKTVDEIRHVCNEAVKEVRKINTDILGDMSKFSTDEKKKIKDLLRELRTDRIKSKEKANA